MKPIHQKHSNITRFMILHAKSHTSEWSSCIISYMSRSTNNFSGDLLLLAIASPKLSSIETLFFVTSAKHCSLSESKPSNIWSQTFLSPANNNFTCSCIITFLKEPKKIMKRRKIPSILLSSYCYTHEMNPVSNFSFQDLPLQLLNIIFVEFFNSKFLKALFQYIRTGIPTW